MTMLRWMCEVTKNDKIRNEFIKGTTRVTQDCTKIKEKRLKGYELVTRRDEGHIVIKYR